MVDVNWCEGAHLKHELVISPVGDIEVAKDFFVNELTFVVEMDQQLVPGFRATRLIPPGSQVLSLSERG